MSLQLEQELAAARKALRECEAARADAERSSALKDEFLAIVSHELRSPLGAILGWAHMLRRRGGEEEFNRGLDVIEQSVHLQAKLIEDLLDMSRITSGQIRLELQLVEPRGFIDAAAEIIRPAAEAKRIRVDKVLDLSASPISGDASRLEQVMVNLLANAVKFTPEEGHIRISLQRVDRWAKIRVADTGIGIPPDFLPHVFDRFRQADSAAARRQGGLGLGLAIARHLVELHGGEIRAESAGEGQGATFAVRLPLAA
ncbi:sensor histidine kinase [Caenimonas soli]|uniref:sensor histidine kinase n=1 Tax=Caenimonas soli TaxID=2735555 RepID=UPI0015517679|nr:HAMP domain-containing sensor histidine kinase [Caenimonas soli]NPC56783.1 HAMP domain-containing histidine kinase [Caenimonas soli]